MTNQLVYISSRRTLHLLMAVGKGFLDQYSVFCVFGSVVGCVVVPLITQVCLLLLYFCLKYTTDIRFLIILLPQPAVRE